MKIYFVDSFTNEKFKGNPAAVCITERELDTDTMQGVAAEIGFSETAFIKQIADNIYNIRFFYTKDGNPIMRTCYTRFIQNHFQHHFI